MKAWMEFVPVAVVAALGCAAWWTVRGVEPAGPRPGKARANVSETRPGKLPAMRNPRILVVKSQFAMTLFDGQRPIRQYRVAVGGNKGDKEREGDRRTPEGQFYICLKNDKSDWHLSLGLSYPNIEDAQRGLREKMITKAQHKEIVQAIRAGGIPPMKTPLGGEIMIHGCRNGRDATLGCVAVENPEIEELFEALQVGTPVEIRP